MFVLSKHQNAEVHRGKTYISLKHSQTPYSLEHSCYSLKSRGDLSYIEIFLNLDESI